MPAKNMPDGTDADLNPATLAALLTDETKARQFVESKLWPNGPVCPHCECKEVYKLTGTEGSKNPVRPGVYKCKACRKQFTVRIGTIFEESKVPLRKWLMAIHLMTISKKGVSSHQIARELGITQKSAWFMDHRIREAMKQQPMAGMLDGTKEDPRAEKCAPPTFGRHKRRGGKHVERSAAELEKLHEARANAIQDRAAILDVGTQEARFLELAAQWKKETWLLSKVSAKVFHIAYQKIIGMGPTAVPLILKDMRDNGPDQWFWALHVITDANPVTKDMTGDVAAMTEAWLQWGITKGYLKDYHTNTSEHSQT
jgi:transposase-like protein